MKLIDESSIKKAYKDAKPSTKKTLEDVYGKDYFLPNIIDKIKNWKDICKLAKIHPEDSLPFKSPTDKLERHLNACFMINKISMVLNQGIVLNFNDINQRKWYPYFRRTNEGWVLSYVYFSTGDSSVGSGFYYINEKHARFAALTFPEIYSDYLPE